ncbi:NEPxGxxU motif selenoprotein TsoC [Candidatus Magnetomonas plexicatena]|uniref:NEPxGxxU motif selenoprotein TsoC n=1 Tax=Candidatus Magnetomonas plexicatena TaxID=2552947 RepID=UPI0011041110|nr:hypothetical protein E2O03_014650 [Nitrospirales bacterium LBB_01]
MQLKLFLNEPLGNRCTNILNSVTSLKNKYNFEYMIMKKSDVINYTCSGCAAPKLPAVSIDGDIVFEGQNVTHEELENEIFKRIKI